MNELSLRVSTIKGNENLKKNSKIRMELMKIPVMYHESGNLFLKEFALSLTVEDQTRVIRQFADRLDNENDTLKIFVKLYFDAPMKHAVRNTLVKIFLQKLFIRKDITAILSHTISESIVCINNDPEDLEKRNNITNSVSGCFDNFQFTSESLNTTNSILLRFFYECIDLYLSKFDTPLSPAKISEITLFLHNTIRVTISCFQQFPNSVMQPDNITVVSKILHQSNVLLENVHMPMDTKTNCGILLIVHAKTSQTISEAIEKIKNTNQSLVSRLCLSIGIISCLDKNFQLPDDLSMSNLELLCEITNVLLNLSNANSIEPNFILGVSRGFVQLTKKLSNMKLEKTNENKKTLIEIADFALDYSFSHLEHHTDSIRHLSKEILKNLLYIDSNNELGIIEKVFAFLKSRYNNDDVTKTHVSKFNIITIISSVLSASVVLKEFPDIGNYIIKSLHNNTNVINNNNILNCYESLMTSNFQQSREVPDALLQWFDLWVCPLFVKISGITEKNAVCCNGNLELIENVYVLVKKAIKINPDIIYQIVEMKCDSNFDLILICLGQAKKYGVFDKIQSSGDYWKNIMPYADLKEAMISFNDNKRISALNLLVESHKSSEIFTSNDLECILYFLQYNCNIQNSAARVQIIAIFRNIFIRLRVGLKNCKNDHTHYREFMARLFTICIKNFFDGASVPRKQISFKLLLENLAVCEELAISVNWKVEDVHMILKCLDDSYETNKQFAIEILNYCPVDIIHKSNHNINLVLIESLLTSIKTADTVSAAYYLDFLLIFEINDSATIHFPKIYKLMLFCEQILCAGLELVNRSILLAAKKNPLYGTLFAIRHLMNKLDFKLIAECEKWCAFISRTIKICIELSDAVGVVVNNSSPEGHLPNDFDIQQLGTDISENVESSCNAITSQMLLVCAWRTVKEVSLILGDIAFKSPIINRQKNNASYGLIECSDVLFIGSHFTKLLSETKHRGAFEQAYVGFSFLCLRLWGAQEFELHSLPMKWLKQMISIINEESEENAYAKNLCPDASTLVELKLDKICSTRRSAGIPFMMQALITSELQVCSSSGLKYCMHNLIDLCKNSTNIESRTHSLNILRALFRATDLSDAIVEFVADGIECAISGYYAVTWMERNSSTLLLSSLMVRVFGVQRTRDSENLNIRNKMTGRIFFQRYPQLYDFFLRELQEASEIVAKGGRSLKLHPMLILLNRLYPSALEGSESNLQLSKYIPLISTCGSCAELQTRYLAAKNIANITSPELMPSRIVEILDLLPIAPRNSNVYHGALLEVLYLFKALSPSSSIIPANFIDTLLNKLLHVILMLKNNTILHGTLIDIIIEIFIKFPNSILGCVVVVESLAQIIEQIAMTTKYQLIGFNTYITKKIVFLQFLLSVLRDEKSSELLAIPYEVVYTNYEAIECILNIHLLIIDHEEMSTMADNYDISDVEIELVKLYLSSVERLKRSNSLKTNNAFIIKIKQIIEGNISNGCNTKAFTILSYLGENGLKIFLGTGTLKIENVGDLITLAETKSSQEKNSIYQCIQTVVRVIVNDQKFEHFDDSFILSICKPTDSNELKITTAQIISTIAKTILFNANVNLNQLLVFSRVTIQLLNDDNATIREHISQLIVHLYNEFYGKLNTENVIAIYAQKIFLRMLTDFLIRNEIKTELIISFCYLLTKTNFDLDISANELDNRIFDKNEVNIFDENYILITQCSEEVEYVMEKFPVEIKEQLPNIIQMASREFPVSAGHVPSISRFLLMLKQQ